MASRSNPFRKSKASVRDRVFGPIRKDRHMRVGVLLSRAKRVNVRDFAILLDSHAASLRNRQHQNYIRGLCGLMLGELWRAMTPADRIRILLPKNITPLLALDIGMFFGLHAEEILIEHAMDLLDVYRKDEHFMEMLRKRHDVRSTPASKVSRPVVPTASAVATQACAGLHQ
jgi:hypothetical protein